MHLSPDRILLHQSPKKIKGWHIPLRFARFAPFCTIQDPHREIHMFCIIKWSWILFVKAETRWQRNPLRGILSDVLLRRRSLRIGWLTQIPHHFGCKFGWVSKSRSSQRIFVSFFHLPKLFRYVKIFCKQRFTNNDGINSVIFHKFLSILRCVRLLQSWTSRY